MQGFARGVDRRGFLTVGTIGGLGLSLGDFFRMQAARGDALDALDTFYQRAYGLISSAKAQEAFDMAKEPDALKDEYGRNQAGMRMLLARRLVESGVRFVTLTYGG